MHAGSSRHASPQLAGVFVGEVQKMCTGPELSRARVDVREGGGEVQTTR